jgi:VWFA-related protein
MRRLACGVLLCAAASAAAAPQRAVFRGGTEVVAVPVSVMQGRSPVTGLNAADFVLLDNGVEQTIESVSMAMLPIELTVILGTAPWTERDRLVRSGEHTDRLHEMLGPEDRIRVVTSGERVKDSVSLQAPSDRFREHREIRQTRGSSAVDALFYALAQPVDPGRRALVVFFTDGSDTWSTLDPRHLPPIVSVADAVIHVVFHDRPSIDSRFPEADRWRDTVDALRDAVRRSGGLEHRLDERDAVLRRVLEDFRSSYLLRYTPTGVDQPGWHQITVTVKRPGRFSIRARQGYEVKAES